MFKDLENFVKVSLAIVIIALIFIGFKLTILFQFIILCCFMVFIYFLEKDKDNRKNIFIVVFGFMVIGNLLYFVFSFINFDNIFMLIKTVFSSVSFVR